MAAGTGNFLAFGRTAALGQELPFVVTFRFLNNLQRQDIKQRIHWPSDAAAAEFERAGVDHCGGDSRLSEKILNLASVVTRLQDRGGEGMTQRMWNRGLGDTSACRGSNETALKRLVVHVADDPPRRFAGSP